MAGLVCHQGGDAEAKAADIHFRMLFGLEADEALGGICYCGGGKLCVLWPDFGTTAPHSLRRGCALLHSMMSLCLTE